MPTLHDVVVEEGADGDGARVRSEYGIPESVEARRRHFQSEEERKAFVFEEGRMYLVDFGNPYLVFNGAFQGGGFSEAGLTGGRFLASFAGVYSPCCEVYR